MRLEGLLGKGLKRAGIQPATPGRLLAGARGQRPVAPGSLALRQNSYTPALFLSPPFPFHSIIFAVFLSFLASPFSKMLQAAPVFLPGAASPSTIPVCSAGVYTLL